MYIKKLNRIILLTFLLTLLCVTTNAEQLRFAVSPSKVEDLHVSPGEENKVEVKFTVGNRTVCSEDNKSACTFDVHVSSVLENYLGEKTDASKIVTFDNSSVTCTPMGHAEVTATINVPKDFEENSYLLYISFTRSAVTESEKRSGNLSTITVPIYMFIGDESKWNQDKPNFKIVESNACINNYPSGDVKSYTKRWLKKLVTLNPIKIYNTLRECNTYPIYYTHDFSTVDVYDGLFKTGGELDSWYKSRWSYLELDEGSNKKCSNIFYEGNSINFINESSEVYTLTLNTNALDYVKKQLLLIDDYKVKTVREVISGLRLPCNQNYEIPDFKYSQSVKELSLRTNTVSGVVNCNGYSNNSQLKIDSISLPSKKQINISQSLSIDTIVLNSVNHIDSQLQGRCSKECSKVSFIESNTLRASIFRTTVIIWSCCWLLIIILIIVIKNYLRDVYTKIESLEDSDENIMTCRKGDIYRDTFGRKKFLVFPRRYVIDKFTSNNVVYVRLSVFNKNCDKELGIFKDTKIKIIK